MTYSNGFWSADDLVVKNWNKKNVEVMRKMAEEEQVGVQKKGRYPDFKGKDGSAAWLNEGKQGQYLSIVLVDKTRLTLFKEVKGQ